MKVRRERLTGPEPGGFSLLEVLVAVLVLGVLLPALIHAAVNGAIRERATRVACLARARGRDVLEELRQQGCSGLRALTGAPRTRGIEALGRSGLSAMVDSYVERVSLEGPARAVRVQVRLTYRMTGRSVPTETCLEEILLCDDANLVWPGGQGSL